VGHTYYAKPILDRLLTATTSLQDAATLAFLGFDLTRTSVHDVDFPIDMLILDSQRHTTIQHRYTRSDLDAVSMQWNAKLREALNEIQPNPFKELF
jgi:putative proteasome-type protease